MATYTLRDNLALSARRLMSLMYHAAVVFLLLESLLLLARLAWPIYLTQSERQLAFTIGSVPALAFILSVYLIEGAAATVPLPSNFSRRSLACLGFMLIPPTAIVLRYIDDELVHIVAPIAGTAV